MPNLFGGFRVFMEKETTNRPDNFVSTMKKQMGVTKKLWFGMPIVLSNVKLGKHMIRQPAAFHVVDFDDKVVTIKPVPYSALDKDGNGDDMDDELDLDPADKQGKQSITITRDNFMKLLEPPNFQGADFATASGTAMGGGGGGMGGM